MAAGIDKTELTTREKVQYSLLGIILLGGTFIVGRRMVKKAIAKSEQSKTLEPGSTATYAKQIKMAFENDGWWGTDKVALRTAIQAIPTKKQFREVIASYKRMYNSNLLQDMQDELKGTEYNEILYIVAAKPENTLSASDGITQKNLQNWARRLKAAFDIYYGMFPGTDEDAIKAVFLEIPSQAAYNELATTYKSMYGTGLAEDLSRELEYWEYEPMMQIIQSKPKN